ncbi:TPA: pentapeptide repeat-containing protein, partial [Bacillus cereus]|nr:pentapeptide repeat-containing protein [Bacillus cereus]
MSEEKLRDWIFCIEAGKIGVGFLIKEDTLLTALHNLEDQLSNIKVYIDKNEDKYYLAECIAKSSEYDLAILKLNHSVQVSYELELNISWDLQICDWRSFSYVKDIFTNGSKINGTILDTTVKENVLIYDLHLQAGLELNYSGASGSPVIVGNKIVGVILKQLKGNTLGAVSFRKAYDFLFESGIEISTSKVVSLEEENFLKEMVALGVIGYEGDEKIPYIETLAKWKRLDEYAINNFQDTEYEPEYYSIIGQKKPGYDFPIPVEQLLEEYFKEINYSKSIKIAFLIADFGKGKSSFLKYSAKKYALSYLKGEEEYFPIYFNLRWYIDYKDFTDLGCIYLYMKRLYNIDLKEQKYKDTKFLFLIDSLDESGELTGDKLDEVLNSARSILTRNGLKYNKDKIILTSRPISHLNKFISRYAPYRDKEDNEYYINLTGFEKADFDLFFKKVINLDKPVSRENNFGVKVIQLITMDWSISEFLLRQSIVGMEEISRPIFAYMLYKLVYANQRIEIDNKLSIFISFINLLTKEAKYIKDDSLFHEYKVIEELKHRNILHASAVNWQFKRHINEDNVLKVKELSKILMETEEEHKAEYHHFYSQSYFGENKEYFYFKHQSFAEILLAEYYLKVLIYAALEDENIQQTRMKLNLGIPTTQTMRFFQGLLSIFWSSINTENKENINSRNQIFPLIGSMIIDEYPNFLNSNKLRERWINPDVLNRNKPPQEAIDNWGLYKTDIEKVKEICLHLIEDETSYTVPIYDQKQNIYNSEVLIRKGIKNNEYLPIDKWISLFAINNLVRGIDEYADLINKVDIKPFVEEMAISNTVFGHVTPEWGSTLLCGMDMSNCENTEGLNFEAETLQGFDASYSELSAAVFNGTDIFDSYFEKSNLQGTTWQEAVLEEVYFNKADLRGTSFVLSHMINTDFSYSYLLGGDFSDAFIENVSF